MGSKNFFMKIINVYIYSMIVILCQKNEQMLPMICPSGLKAEAMLNFFAQKWLTLAPCGRPPPQLIILFPQVIPYCEVTPRTGVGGGLCPRYARAIGSTPFGLDLAIRDNLGEEEPPSGALSNNARPANAG